jgi:uncharacterized membrane protein (DUF485 family)
MNPQELPGGIISRITGLAAGLLRHGLTIGALAAAEARLLLHQSIAILLLAVAMTVAGIIAYASFIGAVVALLAVKLSWGWPVALAAAGMIHMALLGLLYSILRTISLPRPFEGTTEELRKDLESLSRLSNGNNFRP